MAKYFFLLLLTGCCIGEPVVRQDVWTVVDIQPMQREGVPGKWVKWRDSYSMAIYWLPVYGDDTLYYRVGMSKQQFVKR